ncbi:hypothetical protein CVV38_01725 [Candidatus Peregrinibacteria bacterium HGW-Peregrinibacteria-1]|jgi:hypothetical protein|nr:MAG: hypothetical protein CVV38_01725 [Candidatus Peregrinibacteria bacterium HGW-Peregrinibacteria-1]
MENQESKDFSVTKLVYKTIAGLSGGLGGGVVLMVLYVLAVGVTGDLGSVDPRPGLGAVIVGAVLLLIANITGSMLSTFLFALVEKAKYRDFGKALYQIALLNLMVFILLVPVYLISNLAVDGALILIFILQIVFTIQSSHLIFESVANPEGGVAGIYGTTIALLISTIVLVVLFAVINNPMIVLMLAFPVVWGAIGFSQSVISLIGSSK